VTLLLIGLPYAAIVVFIAGLVWRYRSRVPIGSRSSQLLEGRWLVWGAVPFHAGIIVLVLGHLVPLLFPGAWRTFVSNRAALLAVETIGAAAAILALAGLLVLFVRRLSSGAVRASSTAADVVVLAVLIVQVAAGLVVATMHRWGAVWSIGTTTPYLRSIFTLQPDAAYVAGLPVMVTVHLSLAWLVLALIPFTRLVHIFTVPLGYLGRRPQKVVWVQSRDSGARP
jgi:nitrate reductase gamma subunit